MHSEIQIVDIDFKNRLQQKTKELARKLRIATILTKSTDDNWNLFLCSKGLAKVRFFN